MVFEKKSNDSKEKKLISDVLLSTSKKLNVGGFLQHFSRSMSSHPVNSKHDFLFCGFEKIRSINLLDKSKVYFYLWNIKSLQLRLRIEGNRFDFYVLIHSMKDATLQQRCFYQIIWIVHKSTVLGTKVWCSFETSCHLAMKFVYKILLMTAKMQILYSHKLTTSENAYISLWNMFMKYNILVLKSVTDFDYRYHIIRFHKDWRSEILRSWSLMNPLFFKYVFKLTENLTHLFSMKYLALLFDVASVTKKREKQIK